MWKYLLLLAIMAGPMSIAAKTLEYRFRVGEELVYERVLSEDLLGSDAKKPTRYETLAKWNVYPIRRNDDGSWRLVIQTWVKSLRYLREPREDGELGDWKQEPEVRFENMHLGYVDLKPDGSYSVNPTLGDSYLFALLPEMLFVPLPKNDVDGVPLTRTAVASGNSYTLTKTRADDSEVTIAGPYVRPVSANYELIDELVVKFDQAEGQVLELVAIGKSAWKTNPSHTRTTYRLVEKREHSAEWVDQFAAAAERYFVHRSTWWKEKLRAQQCRSAGECRKLVEGSRATLANSAKAEALPEMRVIYEALLAMHDREAEWDIEEATEREALYAMPPINWKSQTLTGQPRNRSDYNGQVVILDFWYRGCHHCILALPKIKQLYDKYQGKPVVVLGVNSDSEIDDAQHVVDTYSLPYESVQNQPSIDSGKKPASSTDDQATLTISAQYTVHSWPTILVLDQQGRIALVVSGNAEDLIEQISSTVDGLLENSRAVP